MSSIASFYRLPRADLDSADEITELLDQAADIDDDYGWSGYVMLNLLMTMEEGGVSLGGGLGDEFDSDEDDDGVLFFATQDDLAAIEGLDLNRLDLDSIGDGLELDDEELREAVAESVTTLHRLIAGTGPNEVLVIAIG